MRCRSTLIEIGQLRGARLVRAVPVTWRRVPQALDVGFECWLAGAVARKLLLANHNAACGVLQPIPATHVILRITPIVAECRRERIVVLTAERAATKPTRPRHSKPTARPHGQKLSRIAIKPQSKGGIVRAKIAHTPFG